MAVNPADPAIPLAIAPARGADPIAWSADGRRLLVRSGIEPGIVSYPLDLGVRNADGSSTRLIHVEGGGDWATWGSFSPDGDTVVFGCCGNATGPYLVGADGGRRRAIIESCETPPSLEGGPGCGEPLEEAAAWAPNGARIAWIDWVEDSAAYGHHARVLSFVNADGTGLRTEVRRVNSPGLSLVWSPDGSRLLTWSEAGHIVVIDVDSLTVRRLTTDGGNSWPVWSPDGTRIAFVRDGSLFTMAADGTDLQAIEGVEPDGAIAWNPAS
jgi:Tol biopolymer transport system component